MNEEAKQALPPKFPGELLHGDRPESVRNGYAFPPPEPLKFCYSSTIITAASYSHALPLLPKSSGFDSRRSIFPSLHKTPVRSRVERGSLEKSPPDPMGEPRHLQL